MKTKTAAFAVKFGAIATSAAALVAGLASTASAAGYGDDLVGTGSSTMGIIAIAVVALVSAIAAYLYLGYKRSAR